MEPRVMHEHFPLPPNLPVPDDDGAADHLKVCQAAGYRVAGDKRLLGFD